MPTFSDFDTRGYRTVDARTGYGEWVATYEGTVEDAMDIELLDTLTSLPWGTMHAAADLGCGTGRTATWLRGRGVAAIDGVDLTPEMLEIARKKGVHRELVEGDVSDTGFDPAVYDLAISSLVDEHLADLGPIYREAFRLVRPGGHFVLLGFHPHFIMASGMPTHFKNAAGEEVAITTHVHLISEHVTTGLGTGFELVEMRERVIDDGWVALKPKWARFRNHPISVAYVWQKPA
jgi:SAM-dependent methyltransferase